MRKMLNVQGMSQFSSTVNPQYQSSACGPTTVHVILRFILKDQSLVKDVNAFYKLLGSTKIGLFKWRFIKKLQRYLGKDWTVSNCTLQEALKQIDTNRPVAMKFDKYFSLQWKRKTAFKYHWVPLIGYEIKDNTTSLIVHDNGWKNRESKIRIIPYENNKKVISFVKIEPR